YILESEQGPEILYVLGKNLESAQQIAKLPERQMIRELARIEAKFATGAAPVPKKTSSASPPPTVLSGKGEVVTDEAMDALNRGDVGAYMRIENERQIARARGKKHKVLFQTILTAQSLIGSLRNPCGA